MACLLTRPSAQALFDQYKNSFSVNVLGGAPVVPESNEWYVVSLNYAMAEEFYAISEQQWKENDPRYACCDNLYALADKDGIFPRPAAAAQGYVIMTGAPGTVLPTNVEISAANGRSYSSVSALPAVVPSSGSVTFRVQDLEAGAAGNASAISQEGTLTTAVPGMDTEVTICGGSFCGGRDIEECEQFRARYLARKQYQPRATQAWAAQKIGEWACVTRVIPRGGNCCSCAEDGDEDCVDCGNSIDFYVMMDGSFPCGVAPQSMLDEIQEWFFGETPGYGMGQAEIGVCGRIVRPEPFYVNVYLDIVACPTTSQLTVIQQQVEDFFLTVSPSVDLRARQIELIAANIVGPSFDISARFELVDPAQQGFAGSPTSCGDLAVNCDYVPCLGELRITGPGGIAGGAC